MIGYLCFCTPTSFYMSRTHPLHTQHSFMSSFKDLTHDVHINMTIPIPVASSMPHYVSNNGMKRCRQEMSNETIPQHQYHPRQDRCFDAAQWAQLQPSNKLQVALVCVEKSQEKALEMMQHEATWSPAMELLFKGEHTRQLIATELRLALIRKQYPALPSTIGRRSRPKKHVTFSPVLETRTIEFYDRKHVNHEAPPTLEELLILKALRLIPAQNYSEFW